MLDRVADLVSGFGVNGRRLRRAIARLTEHPQSLGGLVRDCALPRRTVEALLGALGSDLDSSGMIRSDLIPLYRQRFGYDQLVHTEPADTLASALAAASGLIARMAQDIKAAPVAKRALDHVPATAETVVRRALWAEATFDLSAAHLLCLGDHDLTSLALCAVNSELTVTVVDLDERLLEYLASRAARDHLNVRCLYADFRFGLPESVFACADLILTDPPYTPEGVQLFLGRGLQGLRDRANGRLILAYGFSPMHPALGLKVQAAIAGLDLVMEAILPAFNRYAGAQAVGSASDLYVCRPTARTWQILDKRLSSAVTNIYTHGSLSLEAQSSTPDETVIHHLLRAATGTDAIDDVPVVLVGAERPVSLAQVLAGGLPAHVTARKPTIAAVICADDPGPWLLRTLLAVNADRLAILVPNNHPDLASAAAQHTLISLIAPKYSLRLRRSTPSPQFAIVEAVRADARGLAVDLLGRAHSKVGKVLRESLIRRSADRPAGALTKNEARALIADTGIVPGWLDARLIDLPRHAIGTLIELGMGGMFVLAVPGGLQLEGGVLDVEVAGDTFL